MKGKTLQPIAPADLIALGFKFDVDQVAYSVELHGYDSVSGTKKFFVRLSDLGAVASSWIEIRQGGFLAEINLDGISAAKDIETQLRFFFGKGGYWQWLQTQQSIG